MEPELAIGSGQVSIAAKAYGKDACWVRAGLICGWLPIGNATRHGKLVTTIEEMDSRLGRINYIFPTNCFTNKPDMPDREKDRNLLISDHIM